MLEQKRALCSRAGGVSPFKKTEYDISLCHCAGLSVCLSADFVRYITLVNGTRGDYDELFFRFFLLAEVQSTAERFHDYHGVPKYSNLLHTWSKHKQFYVFADYMIPLLAYTIRLDALSTATNPVFVLCRRTCQPITEFLALYGWDWPVLYIGEEELAE